jgi:hypothetical protein
MAKTFYTERDVEDRSGKYYAITLTDIRDDRPWL